MCASWSWPPLLARAVRDGLPNAGSGPDLLRPVALRPAPALLRLHGALNARTGRNRHARHRRQHAQGRPDRLPRHPHVGPAVPGGHAVRRLHDGRGAGLDAVEPHHGSGVVRRRHGDAGRGQAGPRLRPGFGPGGAVRGRHAAHAPHPRHRRLPPGQGGAGADQDGGVRQRRARRGVRGGADRAVPGRVLVARRAARPAEAHQGRRDGHRRGTAAPGPAAASPRAREATGRQAPPPLQHRGHPVSGTHRDPAHHRLGYHRVWQDGADLRSRLADPRKGRALRDLRQDGHLHPVLLRPRPRRADEPARRPRAALVAVPGGYEPARLRP